MNIYLSGEDYCHFQAIPKFMVHLWRKINCCKIKFGIGLETRLAAKDNALSSESMELHPDPNMPLLEHLVSFRVHYLAELQPSRALKWLPMWMTYYPTNHSNTMSEHSQMRLGMHQEAACVFTHQCHSC